ncbi:molybdopterin molybdotransferase MoeA [Methanolobus mangrovi]|uniref:Molybdopterin molybdotransferase MoeA n=1 Tax=Methanolobus mangrovi TaxID=3072977 RepID=A0AA51UHC8_9EURY|nr:molybdopterin molybdotransferase MoeA [Methanolobus mangrovi]WMW22162.1 molybdopterin molybdotransferase MoeA [Methanolobus mangrovi]
MIFRERTDVGKAKEMFLAQIKGMEKTELLPATSSISRVLSSSILAPRNVPHYRRSAMDGFAVRSVDLLGASPTNPVMLQISDDVMEGTCAPVNTGDYVPDEADAVLMMEDTISIGDMVEIRAQVHPGKNVGEIGEDVRKNEIIFNKSHLLRPCDIAVLASLGINDVKVYAKPVVAIIPTGNDLLPLPGEGIPAPGKTLDINSLMIAKYVEKWGGIARYCDIVPENKQLIEDAICANLDTDMIVVSGGTSVGDKDYVPEVVEKLGKKLVHGVGLSPGKPTALGVADDVPILCMPGYPAAGLVALFAFGKPALRKAGNIPDVPETKVKARMSGKIMSREGYLSYARVILEGNIAHPLMTAGAGILSSIAKSDGFVIIPENVEGCEEGSEVEVVLIE